MNMLDITKKELDKYEALNPSKINPHISKILNTMTNPTVPYRMKAVIATTQLMVFASQFRKNIMLWDDTSVPINTISFVITGSGAGKDSAVNAARKCFREGYEKIDQARNKIAKEVAIKKAISAGEDETLAKDFDIYSKYMKTPPPIDIMPTTEPGLVQHINDIADLNLSCGFMYSGEFADELAYNQDMIANIKVLSEIYDIGNKEAKYTKGAEHRSSAISGQPVSALFVGSPGHILFDEATKKKFHIAFMSKLARRSWFCYTPDKIPERDFSQEDDPIQAMNDYEENLETTSKQARIAISSQVLDITEWGLASAGKHLELADGIFRLYGVYKRYNSELADTLPNQHSTSVLVRRHLQWKALKLAGALAIFDKSPIIEVSHYVDAIRFCELLDNDIAFFEADINKANHERFSDYIRTEVQIDGKAVISVHDLKKQGFITSITPTKLQELVTLAAGYDNSGVYSVSKDNASIHYEVITKTEIIGISYKPINNTSVFQAIKADDKDAIRSAKAQVASTATYGFEVKEATFADLAELLKKDYAYTPFYLKDGVRGKDNIIGGTKWLVLDIDESNITMEEAHFMLSDINHHIAPSSNADNQFKFRILIEFDAVVELDAVAWKHFYLAIAEELGLKVDPVPQSQIFFSYSTGTEKVMSTLDAEPLATRDYQMLAHERQSKTVSAKDITGPKAKALLADPLETFSYAYEAKTGARSRALIRAAYHAKDLGSSKEEVITLVNDINNYWSFPLEDDRFQVTIINQIERWRF